MKKKYTNLKKTNVTRLKVLCLNCRGYSSHKNNSIECCKCGKSEMATTYFAYKVPKKNKNSEWNFLYKLRAHYGESYLKDNIPYLGFGKDWASIHNSNPTKVVVPRKWIKIFDDSGEVIGGRFEYFLDKKYTSMNYDASPILTKAQKRVYSKKVVENVLMSCHIPRSVREYENKMLEIS